jgi:intein/homing endonuclease
MSSQTDITHTSFLERCIEKKRSLQEIWEALGLYRETVGRREDPDFIKEDAKELHESIKKMAQSLKTAYRNDREKLLADLVKEETLAEQIQELEQSFGKLLWGRAKDQPSCYGEQGAIPDELNWDKEADRDS